MHTYASEHERLSNYRRADISGDFLRPNVLLSMRIQGSSQHMSIGGGARSVAVLLRHLRVMICVLLLVSGVSQTHAQDAPDLYENALVLFEQEDFDAAIITLKNALQADGGHLPARVLLGRSYLHAGWARAAEKELRKARSQGADANLVLVPLAGTYLATRKYDDLLSEIPNHGHNPQVDYEISLIHGHAYIALRRFEEAQNAFERADDLVPEKAAPLVGQAMVALGEERTDAAEDLANLALRRNSNSAEAWYVKGNVARERRQSEEALAHFDRALSHDSGHLNAHLRRASTLIDLDRLDDAAADLEYVKEHSVFDVQAVYLNALIKARKDDSDGAREELNVAQEMITSLPSEVVAAHSPTLLLSALIAYSDGRPSDAMERLTLFRQENPGHLGARKLLSQILLEGGDARSARDLLEPLLVKAPDDATLHQLLGEVYMELNRFDLASEMFEKATELSDVDADLQAQIARSEVGRGDRVKALGILRDALLAQPESITAGIMLAQLHLEGEEYAEAIEVLRRLLEEHPQNPTILNLIGTAHAAKNELPEAIAAYDQALALHADYLPSLVNLAKVERLSGDREAAKARLKDVLTRAPDEVESMSELATLAEEEGDLETALFWLEKVRAARPGAIKQQLRLVELYLSANEPETAAIIARELELRHPETLNVLLAVGLTEIAVDRPQAAARVFKRMGELASNDPRWLLEISQYQVRVNAWEGARWTLEKAVTADPSFVEAQTALAGIETRLERFEAALARAEGLLEAEPDTAKGYIVKGEIFMENGRFEDAAKVFRTGLQKQPSAELVIKTYRALQAAKQPGTGLAVLEQWLETHKDDYEVRRTLALGYIYSGRAADALEQHEQLIKVLPEDIALMNNLAWLYQELGDPRAIEFAERAYARAPNHPDVLDTYGWIKVESGEPSEGLQYLREAHVRNANSAEVRYHIAVALSRLGRDAQALKELRKLVTLELLDFHGAAEARELMARLSEAEGAGLTSTETTGGEPAARDLAQP